MLYQSQSPQFGFDSASYEILLLTSAIERIYTIMHNYVLKLQNTHICKITFTVSIGLNRWKSSI